MMRLAISMFLNQSVLGLQAASTAVVTPATGVVLYDVSDLVARVRRLARQRRVGHAGALLLDHGGRGARHKAFVAQAGVGLVYFTLQSGHFFGQALPLGRHVNFHMQGQAGPARNRHGQALGGCNEGGFVLTVAIADVAFYVRPRAPLDKDALERGNSVYFPDRVVPMLPERISNDLCSLRPNEDRAALAVRMIIAADGRKKSHTFHRVLMRSAAKLSYQQAQAAVGGTPDDVTGPLLDNILKPLYAAYDALKRARDARGPLDLDLPERKIVLKHDGTVDRVTTPERLESHRLIEEFMILANVAAAETLEQTRVPLIYRVHDEPSLEKIEAFEQRQLRASTSQRAA